MKQSGLPLRGIGVFETVARLGSLKAAARELNLSPSAVSHQIRALEEQLGVELFKRVSRGVQLSADAAKYADVLHGLFDRMRRATATRLTEAVRTIPHFHLTADVMAERLLAQKGVTDIEKIRIDLDPSQREIMMQKTGRRTVPQIYVDSFHVGGYDDLNALDKAGKLDPLLSQTEQSD